MRFTRYTDYAIRVLIHLGTNADELCSIADIAHAYDISQNHLRKIAQDLATSGFVEAVRGRNGGLRLGRPTKDINLGALVRHTEIGLVLVDCENCAIRSACTLPSILAEAVCAFLAVLDRYTLEDLLKNRSPLHAILWPSAA